MGTEPGLQAVWRLVPLDARRRGRRRGRRGPPPGARALLAERQIPWFPAQLMGRPQLMGRAWLMGGPASPRGGFQCRQCALRSQDHVTGCAGQASPSIGTHKEHKFTTCLCRGGQAGSVESASALPYIARNSAIVVLYIVMPRFTRTDSSPRMGAIQLEWRLNFVLYVFVLDDTLGKR